MNEGAKFKEFGFDKPSVINNYMLNFAIIGRQFYDVLRIYLANIAIGFSYFCDKLSDSFLVNFLLPDISSFVVVRVYSCYILFSVIFKVTIKPFTCPFGLAPKLDVFNLHCLTHL